MIAWNNDIQSDEFEEEVDPEEKYYDALMIAPHGKELSDFSSSHYQLEETRHYRRLHIQARNKFGSGCLC